MRVPFTFTLFLTLCFGGIQYAVYNDSESCTQGLLFEHSGNEPSSGWKVSVGEPDYITCPQTPNEYCNCRSDCSDPTRSQYCICAEAQECCLNSGIRDSCMKVEASVDTLIISDHSFQNPVGPWETRAFCETNATFSETIPMKQCTKSLFLGGVVNAEYVQQSCYYYYYLSKSKSCDDQGMFYATKYEFDNDKCEILQGSADDLDDQYNLLSMKTTFDAFNITMSYYTDALCYVKDIDDNYPTDDNIVQWPVNTCFHAEDTDFEEIGLYVKIVGLSCGQTSYSSPDYDLKTGEYLGSKKKSDFDLKTDDIFEPVSIKMHPGVKHMLQNKMNKRVHSLKRNN